MRSKNNNNDQQMEMPNVCNSSIYQIDRPNANTTQHSIEGTRGRMKKDLVRFTYVLL